MLKFEDFYHKTFKGLFRFIFYKGLTKDETQDLVHEAYTRFIAGYMNLLDVSDVDEEHMIKLLYGIAKNIWKDFISKKITEQEKFADFEASQSIYGTLDEAIEEYSDPLISKKLEYDIALINKAIEELNPTVKKVIKLKYIQNYTRKEIAKELNISEDIVHTYQKRGVKYLKNKLNCTPSID